VAVEKSRKPDHAWLYDDSIEGIRMKGIGASVLRPVSSDHLEPLYDSRYCFSVILWNSEEAYGTQFVLSSFENYWV